MVEFPFTFRSETANLPRIDFKLSLGEDPTFERVTKHNAYAGSYVRLTYRKAMEVSKYDNLYILCATEVVDATKDPE